MAELEVEMEMEAATATATEPDWRALDAAFVPGDVLRFRRGAYSHLAVFVGRGRVVHLWSPATDGFQVRMDTLRTVMRRPSADRRTAFLDAPERCTEELDARMLREHSLAPFAAEEVVARARSRLGESPRYDYVSSNCEHFVTWARYGQEASPQVASHAGDVLTAAMLGAAVGGAAGLILGGLFSLFSKADALSASVGATATSAASASMETRGEWSRAAREGEAEIGTLDDEDDRLSSISSASSSSSAPSASPSWRESATSEPHTAERARLWAEVSSNSSAARADSEEGLAAMARMEDWVASRRRDAAAASARKYGDDRHEVLASRLAEDRLQCGICYSNLLRVRSVAFPCNHFSCTVCFNAFHVGSDGHKSCPYCRSEIAAVDEIHKTTKLRAKHILHWE